MTITVIITSIVIIWIFCAPANALEPKFKAIAQGPTSGLALDKNGDLWYWGSNFYSESTHPTNTSDSSSYNKPYPVRVDGVLNATEMEAGNFFCVALAENGTVWTWGWSAFGQLGYDLMERIADRTAGDTVIITNGNYTILDFTPLMIPDLADIEMVSAGELFCVALMKNGTVWTWGNNNYGQLCNGTNITSTMETFHGRSQPEKVEFLDDVAFVTAGPKNGAAIKRDGTVWIWGARHNALFGAYGKKHASAIQPYQGISVPVLIEGIDRAMEIKLGEDFAVALRDDGTVWTWGWNGKGQLSNSNKDYVYDPAVVPGLADIVQIAAGNRHCLALRDDGTLLAWGDNGKGQLCDGTTTNRYSPIEVPLTNVVAIAAGGDTSIALDENGTIWTWGDNYYGQLGNFNKPPTGTVKPEATATPGFEAFQLIGAILVMAIFYSHPKKKKR